MRSLRALALAVSVVSIVTACGLDVQLPDLFLLTRTGQGSKLTLLVNDSGSISCDGGRSKQLSSSLLITARDLADNLSGDAKRHLRLPLGPSATYDFTIRLQQGTIRFSDRNTARHPHLAQAELFALQAAQQVCGLPG